MSLNLLLHVKGAKLDLFEQTALVVKATVNGESKSTGKLSSVKTVWNEDLNFKLNHIIGDLWIELLTISLRQQQSLGLTHIPLYSVRHSNKALEGQWYTLIAKDDNGLQESTTSHMISLDVHFELPKNIPVKELEMLEKKLSKLQCVLEDEITVINNQYNEIKTRSLPLPDNSPGKYTYPDSNGAENPLPFKRFSSASKSVSFSEDDDNGGPQTPPRKKKFDAKQKWQDILNKPEFQQRMRELQVDSHDLSTSKGWKSSNLAALVSHLQERKKIDQISDEKIDSFSGKVHARRLELRRRSRHNVYEVKDTIDEDFRIIVYSRALAAMIYPASKLHAHSFVEKSFRSPTYCAECEQFIWGLTKQGVQCQRCGKNSHKKCAVSAKHDCFHIRDSITSTVQESHIRAITTAMNNTLVSQKDKFELLRKAFSISEVENSSVIDQVTSKVTDLAKHFSATIKVKILTAQGIALNPQADPRIYVSIDVGGVKAKTKPFKDRRATIQWEEEFEFECSNYLEPIKIRVWNEKHTTMSKLTQKLTQEGDMFLGQKVIEVLRLGAPHTLWYKLDKRTDNDIVSGSIQLNLSSVVSGETVKASYYDMYSLLHEQLFLYTYIRQRRELVICPKDPIDDPVFLPDLAQAILDEFASRYAVESFYRSMIHLKLLIDHSSLPKSHIAINNMLMYTKQKMFMLSAEENAVRGVGLHTLMFELLQSSNFGRDELMTLLQKLTGQLLVNLQSYRDNYPACYENRASEIADTCQLLKTVAEFQNQAIGMDTKSSTLKVSKSIEEAMKECIRTTFDEIVQDLISDYHKEHPDEHPAMDKNEAPYNFYYLLLKQMTSAVVEDKKVYQPYVQDFNLEAVSMLEMWEQFKILIQDLFKVEKYLHVFPPIEAMHLLIYIKKFFEERVQKLMKDTEVDYPLWFEPAVKYWIQDFQNGALNFINNSWDYDRKQNFRSENNQDFSSSAYDMFTYFHRGHEVTQGLDGGLISLKHTYAYEFAKVIKFLILHYVDLVSVEIPNSSGNLEVCCMLVNDLHFIRFGIQSLFETMGGIENAGEQCTEELQSLQSVLSKQLNSWCPFIINSQKDNIWNTLKQSQGEIIKLKAQGPDSREDAKQIVEIVMDGLFERAKTIGQVCEKETILPKLIKELWYVVMEGLQNILLPNVPAIGNKDQENVFHSVHYNQRQCTIIDHFIDILKDFFMDDRVGVKESTLDRNVKQMKAITKLYRQPTEYLIEECLKSSNSIDTDQNESFGQMSLEMTISRRPASGGTEGTLRVVSIINVKRLNASGGVSKMLIEFNFVFPSCQSFSKYRYSVSTTNDVNQQFKFTLPPTSLCDLQVTIKHKSLMGADQILGVATVPFATILKNRLYTMDLLSRIPHNEKGRAFLTILSLRNSDEVAREFVVLRTYHRTDNDN